MTRAWVQLNDSDMAWARHVAQRRQDEAISAGLPDRYGADTTRGLDLHVYGALGERAVSRLTGRYVEAEATVNTFHTRPDVGPWEVRTRTRHAYELIHRPQDNPEAAYILVTGNLQQWNPATGDPPCVWVRGWIKGGDARRPEWLKDHGRRSAAWFVPTDELRELAELQPAAYA